MNFYATHLLKNCTTIPSYQFHITFILIFKVMFRQINVQQCAREVVMEIIFHQSSYRVLLVEIELSVFCCNNWLLKRYINLLTYHLYHHSVPVYSVITSSTSVLSLLGLLGTVAQVTGNTDQLLILGQFVRRCGFNYLTFKSLEVEMCLIIYPHELAQRGPPK